MNKIKVGVLMGGLSLEKEVSFNSGRTICDHLDINIYDCIPLFQTEDNKIYILPWRFLHRGKISDFIDRLPNEGIEIKWSSLKEKVDFIYLALHGKYAEDGSIQSMLNILKIPYSGSDLFACASTFSKSFHNKFLNIFGIKTPTELLIKTHEDNFEKAIEFSNKIGFPVIIKPDSEGSSIGVSIALNKDELIKNIDKSRNINKEKTENVIIQEKIEGLEFSCILIQINNEWKAFKPTEIAHKSENYLFDYKDKYLPGAALKFTPARTSEENIKIIQDISIKIAKIIDAKDILRVDGFINKQNEIIIIETNTFPGAAPAGFIFSQAALDGISHTKLINHIIFNAIKRYSNIDKNNIKKEIFNKKNEEEKEKKMKIAVIFGGETNEKEVSLESGRNVFYKLSPDKYDTVAIFVSPDLKFYQLTIEQLVKDSTKEILHSLKETQEIHIENFKNLFDFVFIALHGGYGEGGAIQSILDMFNIPYNGSGALTSALCMDKFKTNNFLKANGFDIPNSKLISAVQNDQEIESEINKLFNVSKKIIVKPHDDGCSFKISLCENTKQTLESIKDIFNSGKQSCMIEEYIDGIELTIGVIGNESPLVLPPTEVKKKSIILSLEEKFLPGEGENITPTNLSKEDADFVKNEIFKAYKALSCSGYVRIDCFFQNKDKSGNKIQRLILLEFNTLPALTPATCLFHQAAEVNITPMKLIDTIIQNGLIIKGIKK
jgi:UDP-N-acetylmuramate--alanine ligase